MKIITSPGHAEIVVKASRFIADVVPVRTEDEARQYLAGVKKKYWDARHHCHAFVLFGEPPVMRSSDDGEPSGTAGRPILDVITGAGVSGCLIVVTRYFGGTLLGTGGLVRAYSGSASQALSDAKISECITGRAAEIRVDYGIYGKLKYFIEKEGLAVLDTDFADDVCVRFVIPEESLERITQAIQDIAGKTPEAENAPASYVSDGKGQIVRV